MAISTKVTFPEGTFEIDSGAGIYTQFRKKRRFKSISAIFRYFKVNNWNLGTCEILLKPGIYKENIELNKTFYILPDQPEM